MNIRRGLAALAATAPLVFVTACSFDKPDPAPAPPPKPTLPAGDTHDGAISVSAYTSYVDAFRKGYTEVACGFTTPEMQKALIVEAFGKPSKKRACMDAVGRLKEQGSAPEVPVEFRVVSAHDDVTVLLAHLKAGVPVKVTLESLDGQWLVASAQPAPAETP